MNNGAAPGGKPSAFLKAFAAAAFLLLLSLPIVNPAIDPYWQFDLIEIPGLNSQKGYMYAQERWAKPQAVCKRQPSAVVLGTSRVELGIDPSHPAWQRFGGTAYNLAMPGVGIGELLLHLKHAAYASKNLRLALVGLDFLMFNAHREALMAATEAITYDPDSWVKSESDSCARTFFYNINGIFGLKALGGSLVTVVRQMDETDRDDPAKVTLWLALINRLGYRDQHHPFELRVAIGGYHALFGTAQEKYYAERVWRPPPDGRFCFTRSGGVNTLDVFRDLVRFAHKSGVDVRLFINPIHARMLIAIQEAGLWPQYEEWKQALVQILAEEAARSGSAILPLWDFSGFNSVATEPVPPPGDREGVVKWFWEPSHYKKATGDMMVSRMLDHANEAAGIPEDFGVLLTASNIDAWIARNREAAREYRQTRKADTDLVREVVAQVMASASGANCGYDMQALHEGSEALRRGQTHAAEQAFARAISVHERERRRFAEIGVPFQEKGFARALERARSGRPVTGTVQ
jgi:hypothetical protein